MLEHFSRAVVFDPLSEYREGIIFTDLSVFASAISEHIGTDTPFCFICRFQGPTLSATEREYHAAAQMLWHVRNVCLLLEEVEQYLSSYDGDNAINYLISFGRHRRVSLIGIGRRPADISIKLRAQFTTVVSFVQNEPDDIAHLKNWGFNAQEIATLGPHSYAYRGENPAQFSETANAPANPFRV